MAWERTMISFYHLIDVLPFVIASMIILLGPMKVSLKRPITLVIIFTTATYMVAQSAWFSSWMGNNEWGREISNYVWFLFNTLTMVIFAWSLNKK